MIWFEQPKYHIRTNTMSLSVPLVLKKPHVVSCFSHFFFYYGWGDRVETAAESLSCIIAISVYDETWICLTCSGQHKGLNSKQGTKGPSWRLAQLRSTSQSPPAYCCPPGLPQLPSATHPFPHLPCFDKPHLHPSHILLPLLISAQSISSVHHTTQILYGGSAVASAVNAPFILSSRCCRADFEISL